MALRLLALALLAVQGAALSAAEGTAQGAVQQGTQQAAANPIRKVVTMLQAMQKKVQEEGEKEKELFEKFMCYCKTSGGDLAKSIEEGEAKVSSLGSELKSATELKTQTAAALKQAQTDRTDARKTMAEATALREKDAAAFADEKAELDSNIGAIKTSVTSISKGMSGAFLQTGDAKVLQKLAQDRRTNLQDEERQDLMSFLSGAQGSGYVPASAEVLGILKGMGDEMESNLAEATATEEAAIKSYEELMTAKKKEESVLTAAIETKMKKVGELGVAIVQMKGDLADTVDALAADKEFQANLQKGCSTKQTEWDERSKTRAEELLALAETIKLLNDDDALELFKKTLPSASSFVQMRATTKAVRRRALAMLQSLQALPGLRGPQLDLLVLALRGKKIGFEKVIKMVDEMVETLKTEQADDDHKKEYCGKQFDLADDKKKALERSLSDTETAIDTTKDDIATTKEEIAALKAGIVALDKSVAEATEQRKQEHEEFSELMAADTAAKELLSFAKNRLNKFYNPKLYKPPAKKELSADDRIMTNMGVAGAVFAQVSAHKQTRDAPPPPPETFGAYTKKSEENLGVMAMMDLLVKDLDKEMTEAETEEKDAQADYVTAMKDAAEKRTKDSKSLTQKEDMLGEMEGDLEEHKDTKASTGKELKATLAYIASLHADCDWLQKYFDVRKEARTSEIDALTKAKAVLSGADYSFTQTASRGHLRGSA